MARGPPPPFSVSVDPKAFGLFYKLIRINTCGQFLEVLILVELWSDKRRQNSAKHGVPANDENKGFVKLRVAENKKRQLGAGAAKATANYYLEGSISHSHFLSRKNTNGDRSSFRASS